MSADNILGIYKVNNRKYVGRDCWSECKDDCKNCSGRIIFTAKSVREAVMLAQRACSEDIFEYGYEFLYL